MNPVPGWDVFPDGSFVTRVEDEGQPTTGAEYMERFGATELRVILNFFEELKARVGN